VLKIYVVMHVLKAYGRPHPQKVYPRDEYPLREVIDRFVIEGPKGKHICIVHAPPPIDLAEWISGDKLRLEAMKSSIRQLLIILDYLHTDCFTTARICAIVMCERPPDTDYELGVDPIRYHEANHEANPDLEAEKASELTTTLLPGDGVPLFIDYPDDDAKAGLVAKHIRAPEEILKSPWDYKVDIWSVAICVSRVDPKISNRGALIIHD
jgi:non-specific serine/threonine protein kinase